MSTERVQSSLADVGSPSQALMKIMKHARESHQMIPAPAGTSNATVSFSPAVGQLLGIDSNGVLEVSNAFPLPSGSLGGAAGGDGESETRGVKAGASPFQLVYDLPLTS